MAQSSRPQPGNRNAHATWVDSGPYSGNQWATLFRVLFTGDQEASQGVLKTVWGELATTHPVANLDLQIDTGAGICNGHWYQNTTAVTIAVTAAGGSRSDTLVLLENNTNAALLAGPGNAYDTVGNASIPPYSTRLAVVKGVAITQNLALWMVPLYTFTTGPANITLLTSVRTFCRFATMVDADNIEDRTRYIFAPCVGTSLALAYPSGGYGAPLSDGVTSHAYGYFTVPADYASGMSIQLVATSQSAGNIFCRSTYGWGGCGEDRNDQNTSVGYGVEAITALTNNCIQSANMATVSAGDIAHAHLERVGGVAQDTLNDVLNVVGWLITYTADS